MNKEFFKNILTTQIPIAWIAGVRLESWEEHKVATRVKLGFLNQNPFKSMFWAVQGMAAEFSSGLMANAKIAK
ncbi:MAG: thioesterase, partial [Algoriella sp.]